MAHSKANRQNDLDFHARTMEELPTDPMAFLNEVSGMLDKSNFADDFADETNDEHQPVQRMR